MSAKAIEIRIVRLGEIIATTVLYTKVFNIVQKVT